MKQNKIELNKKYKIKQKKKLRVAVQWNKDFLNNTIGKRKSRLQHKKHTCAE